MRPKFIKSIFGIDSLTARSHGHGVNGARPQERGNMENTNTIDPTGYALYDAESRGHVPCDDGSEYDYDAAIVESLGCRQAEGIVMYLGRRVYAM